LPYFTRRDNPGYQVNSGGNILLDRFRYEVKLMGKLVILTPILVMVGFALLAELLNYLHTNPARMLSASLEMILPLAAAIVVATITSQDSAIELQLTMPQKYSLTALSRLTIITIWTLCIALLSSICIFVVKLDYFPQPLPSLSAPLQFLVGQLTWLAPLLWLVGIGLCLALVLRSRPAGVALLSGIWIAEIIFKDYIAANGWLHPVLLFPTSLLPLVGPVPQTIFNLWLTTRFELIGSAIIFILLGWLLLRNPEALLKTSIEE
jgi:hypothetical protein